MKKFPHVARWFRPTDHFYYLLTWNARAAARAWSAVWGWLVDADRRQRRRQARKPVTLAIERMEPILAPNDLLLRAVSPVCSLGVFGDPLGAERTDIGAFGTGSADDRLAGGAGFVDPFMTAAA